MSRLSFRAIALSACVAGLAFAGAAAPAQANPIERVMSTPTGWLYYYGVTPAQLGTVLSSGNYRIVDLQVESASASGPVFTVALVANTGDYGKGWWWYYGQTIPQVSAALTANNARLISIAPYVVNGTTYFASVMVPNTGTDAKTWYWWVGSVAQINANVTATGTRLVDLEPFSTASGTSYAAIAIANSGADADAWWWYVNASAAGVANAISTNHAQLLTFGGEPGTGNFDVTMQGNPTAAWWYYYGLDPSTLSAVVQENGARLTQLRSNLSSGRHFNAIMINNSNACSSRLISIAHGAGTGYNGHYLRQVSGKAIPGGPVLCAGSDAKPFEPASAIKVVIATYAMRQVQNGVAKLTDIVPRLDPNNFCSFAQIGTETLSTAITEMMKNSDNARTDMLLKRYGLTTITNYAHSLGMPNTATNFYVDCPGGSHNTFTLDDAATLYSGLAAHTILSKANVTKLFGMMAGRNYDFAGMWADLQPIIAQEAPANLSAAKRATFTAAIALSYKPGGYTWPGGIPDLNGQTEYGDEGIDGLVSLPFCAGTTQSARQFVFGFFHQSTASTADQTPIWNAMGAGAELLREQVRDSLASWKKCG